MSGIKVSDLISASNVAAADLLYLVNSGNPRKFTLTQLIQFLLDNNVVTTVNGHAGTAGAVTVSKSDVGLGNVTNTVGVTSLAELDGDVTVTGSTGVSITGNSLTKTLNIDVSAVQLPFGQITGDPLTNSALAVALASVGVQIQTRTIDTNSPTLELDILDIQRPWVNVDFVNPVQLKLTTMNAPAGAMIELRQASGAGVVTVTALDGGTVINQPYGTYYATRGLGTRIQLISLGGNAWEFR